MRTDPHTAIREERLVRVVCQITNATRALENAARAMGDGEFLIAKEAAEAAELYSLTAKRMLEVFA